MDYEELMDILTGHFPEVIPPLELLQLKQPILKLHTAMKNLKSGNFDSRNLGDESLSVISKKLKEEEETFFRRLGVEKYHPSNTGVTFELNFPTSPPLGINCGLGLILVIQNEVKDKIKVTREMRGDLYLTAEDIAIELSRFTNPKPESARIIKNLRGLQTRPWEHQFIFLPAAYGDHAGYPVFRGKQKTAAKMEEVFQSHLDGTIIKEVPGPLEKWLIKQIEQPE